LKHVHLSDFLSKPLAILLALPWASTFGVGVSILMCERKLGRFPALLLPLNFDYKIKHIVKD